MAHAALRRASPAPLKAVFNDVLRTLKPSPKADGTPQDGFLYSGNRHDSLPRALLLDRRLTPLERNAWQVLHVLLDRSGLTAFPTYERLRPYLAVMPCATQASNETVARALALLRLTRWLSLVRRQRDPHTGRIQGNLYVLHDEPLTPFEAIQLDPDYLKLVSQALSHAAKTVQVVARQVLKEVTEDPQVNQRSLPTRLQIIAQRLAQQGWTDKGVLAVTDPEIPKSEDSTSTPSSDSEAGAIPDSDDALRNPKADRTVRKVDKELVRTKRTVSNDLVLPPRFLTLDREQQSGALAALKPVEPAQRQAILDEWAARCERSAVRNPAGYLFGIIQKALRGEFNRAAASTSMPTQPPLPPEPTPIIPAEPPPARACQTSRNPEVGQAHLDQLRSALRLPPRDAIPRG